MTRLEGEKARAEMARQELSKTPAGKLAYESAQRTKQRMVNPEDLKEYESTYSSINFERKKTEIELEIEEKLKDFM